MKAPFVSTITVAAVKAQENDTKFQILQNDPAKGKFWRCGSIGGPVSTKGYMPDPVVSTTEDGTMILHSRSAAKVLETL